MRALVLIGGFGTRLRPLTYEVPKQLIPIAGKPLLHHVLDLLPAEVDHVVLATGYRSEDIARHLWGQSFRFGVEIVAEPEPLGTGGAMRFAGGGMSDPFLLLNSDVVSQLDVGSLLDAHRRHDGIGTIYLSEVDDTRPYGVAALGTDDRIVGFVEKPTMESAPSHWINAGVAVWSHRILSAIPPGRPVSFEREVLPSLLPERVYGFQDRGFWEDAGTPERLLHAQRLLFDAGRAAPAEAPAGAIVTGPVSAGRGASAAGARLGPYVTIGRDAEIGPGAELSDAVVMDGARIGEGAVVVRSILGPGVVVAPGRRVEGEILAARPAP